MAYAKHETTRLTELKEMLAAYRQMTIEEAEAGGVGDLQIEMEQEVWLLEQEQHSRTIAAKAA